MTYDAYRVTGHKKEGEVLISYYRRLKKQFENSSGEENNVIAGSKSEDAVFTDTDKEKSKQKAEAELPRLIEPEELKNLGVANVLADKSAPKGRQERSKMGSMFDMLIFNDI